MDFEKESKIVELFIGCARTYLQIASAVLVLTTSFHKTILGSPTVPVTLLLVVVWLLLLASILFSMLYQFVAVKHLQVRFNIGAIVDRSLPEPILERPGMLYNSMQYCFYLGALLFALIASAQLFA